MKKLLLLGGLRYLLPVIEAAHRLGVHVITCDYIPENIAHKYSDEYHNVSITDKEAVLNLAKELKIDGIMSFAVDPGVLTAAYVAEQLGLPTCGSFESVKILQNKVLFRDFLLKHKFNVPKSIGAHDYNDVLKNIEPLKMPLIVKPVDAAGSKGVVKVEDKNDLKEAFEFAINFSITKQVIIEEFIEKIGFSSDSDGFSVEGKLICASFNRQYFDKDASNPYTPAAYSWPSSFTQEEETELKSELERLVTLLDLKTSVYNIEVRVGDDGKPYIMEFTPRGGGNRLSEMIRFGTGVDFITNSVRAAVGLETMDIKPLIFDGYWAEIILHANINGKFSSLFIDEKYRSNVIQEDIWVKSGEAVRTFSGANDAIGTLVLKFNVQNELDSFMTNYKDFVKVIVK